MSEKSTNEIKEILFRSLHDAISECNSFESEGCSVEYNPYYEALIRSNTIHDLVEKMGLLVEYVTSSYYDQEV